MKIVATILFFLIVPGAVILYIPVGLAFSGLMAVEPVQAMRYAAVFLWAAGGLIVGWAMINLIGRGRGSPVPFDHTNTLVETGLYHYSRNPMYLGAAAIVFGHYFWFQSWLLLVYAAVVLLSFHLFIVFFEEPRMRRRFGKSFNHYCRRVPRWFIK